MSTASIVNSLAERNGCSAQEVIDAASSFEKTGEVPEGISLSPEILAMVVSIGATEQANNAAPEVTPEVGVTGNSDSPTDRPHREVSSPPTTPIPIIKRNVKKPLPSQNAAFPKRQSLRGDEDQGGTIYDQLARKRGVAVPPPSLKGDLRMESSQSADTLDQGGAPSVAPVAKEKGTLRQVVEPTLVPAASTPASGDQTFDAQGLLESLGIDDETFEEVSLYGEETAPTYSPFLMDEEAEQVLASSQGPLLTEPDGESVSVIDEDDLYGEPTSIADGAFSFVEEDEEDPLDDQAKVSEAVAWSPSQSSTGPEIYADPVREMEAPKPAPEREAPKAEPATGSPEKPAKADPKEKLKGRKSFTPVHSFDDVVSGEPEESVTEVEETPKSNKFKSIPISDDVDVVEVQQSAPKKKSNKLLITLVILLTFVSLVLLGAMFFGYTFHDIFGVGYQETYSPLNFFISGS